LSKVSCKPSRINNSLRSYRSITNVWLYIIFITRHPSGRLLVMHLISILHFQRRKFISHQVPGFQWERSAATAFETDPRRWLTTKNAISFVYPIGIVSRRCSRRLFSRVTSCVAVTHVSRLWIRASRFAVIFVGRAIRKFSEYKNSRYTCETSEQLAVRFEKIKARASIRIDPSSTSIWIEYLGINIFGPPRGALQTRTWSFSLAELPPISPFSPPFYY